MMALVLKLHSNLQVPVGTATPLPRVVDDGTNVTVFVVPSALSTVVRAGGGDGVDVKLVALLTAAAHITWKAVLA